MLASERDEEIFLDLSKLNVGGQRVESRQLEPSFSNIMIRQSQEVDT